ncbi:hypothetical protein D3261_00645 [Halococcus sp. IIIV-5B]|nr:hypothetical protein D3261_00645 [Halococcus sp. IIIV-5B]
MGAIGIPLVFGVMIDTFFAECGGACRIATTLVRVVHMVYVPCAVGISGVVVAIPVFSGVALIVLAPMMFVRESVDRGVESVTQISSRDISRERG